MATTAHGRRRSRHHGTCPYECVAAFVSNVTGGCECAVTLELNAKWELSRASAAFPIWMHGIGDHGNHTVPTSTAAATAAAADAAAAVPAKPEHVVAQIPHMYRLY